MAIGIDRYQAIMYPLAKKQSKKTARVLILCIWIMASVLALPMGAAHTFEQVVPNWLVSSIHMNPGPRS